MCAELDTYNDHYCFGSLKSNLLQLRPLRTRRSFSLSATSSADASLVSLRVRVCVCVCMCVCTTSNSPVTVRKIATSVRVCPVWVALRVLYTYVVCSIFNIIWVGILCVVCV